MLYRLHTSHIPPLEGLHDNLVNLNGLPRINTTEFDALPGHARSSAAGDCTRVSGIIGEYFSSVPLAS